MGTDINKNKVMKIEELIIGEEYTVNELGVEKKLILTRIEYQWLYFINTRGCVSVVLKDNVFSIEK